MADDLFFFTQDDVINLQKQIDALRRLVRRAGIDGSDGPPPKANDQYVIYPTENIPAADDKTPGKLNCKFWLLDDLADPPVLEEIADYDEDVYNIGDELEKDKGYFVQRHKSGPWMVVAAVGGTARASKIGITTADIFYGDSGTIAITRRSSSGYGSANPLDTGERIENVFLDQLTRDDIAANTEVKIEYFADEGLWRITGCDCTTRSIGNTPPVAGF